MSKNTKSVFKLKVKESRLKLEIPLTNAQRHKS